eukprot:2930752-Pyramimonas_sp.AAC.1
MALGADAGRACTRARCRRSGQTAQVRHRRYPHNRRVRLTARSRLRKAPQSTQVMAREQLQGSE